MNRGWKLAAKAWKTGKPTEGFKTDMFKPGQRAISADAANLINPHNVSLSGFAEGGYNTLGWYADFLGTTTRLPGKLLMSVDEFFKAMNYDGEIHARAFREATNLGLEGKGWNRVYQAITDGADDAINMESMTSPSTIPLQRSLVLVLLVGVFKGWLMLMGL